MEAASRASFHIDIAHHAARAFGIHAASLCDLGGFENFVYEAQRDGQPVILRIAHDLSRTRDQIEAELDFIEHLASEDLAVLPALTTPDGHRVVEVEAPDGSSFFAANFARAPGSPCPAAQGLPGRMPAGVPEQIGRFMGAAHKAALKFRPPPGRQRQHSCVDETWIEARVPRQYPKVLKRLKELQKEIRQLPRADDAYGLIHHDLHRGNLFITHDAITVFDFDDCEYGHFVQDIAISIFTGLEHDPEVSNRDALNQAWYDQFMTGYSREYSLSETWLRQLPLFLDHRSIILYVINTHCRSPSEYNRWWQVFLQDRPEKIASGEPLANLDWY